ncbi:MFS transporter [Corynebacterium flavescens]|uniref:MFS transporter n=2 Tax=Corynebacterium flavescens TaxID=28028 RepID=A0AB73B8B1_CORFL|nr:MFS transporter [Corynebacterium flavescens]
MGSPALVGSIYNGIEIYLMSDTTARPNKAPNMLAPNADDTGMKGAPGNPERLGKEGKRALIAAMSGTVIEWYDYALYGAAAGLVIGPLFFQGSAVGGQLAAFATFAVGFVARPLGGVLIGHIGDSWGRRPAMMLSIMLMGIATVGIGLLPTQVLIGVAAPILLVLFRLIQGMGAGAELAGAMTIVAEFAPLRMRAFFTALVLSTPPLGMAMATGAFLAVSSLGEEALLGGAWRIPFLASAVLFAVAIFIRRRLEETPEYVAAVQRTEEQREEIPFVALLKKSWREVVIGFGAVTGHNALNYAMAVFGISLMTSPAVGMERPTALAAVTLGTLAGVLGTPFGGLAADKFGAGRVLAIGSLCAAVFAFPLFNALSSGNAVLAGVMIAVGYGFIIAMTSGAQGAFLASLFGARERYSGIALARELNGAVVAGFTPLVLAWIIQASGGRVIFGAIAVAICCAISVASVLAARTRTVH